MTVLRLKLKHFLIEKVGFPHNSLIIQIIMWINQKDILHRSVREWFSIIHNRMVHFYVKSEQALFGRNFFRYCKRNVWGNSLWHIIAFFWLNKKIYESLSNRPKFHKPTAPTNEVDKGQGIENIFTGWHKRWKIPHEKNINLT